MHPGELGKCRACDKPVRWVETAQGKRMPLDPDPDPDGNVVIEGGRARVLANDQVPASLDSYVWMPHFATCLGHARGRDAQRRALRRTHARVERERAEGAAVPSAAVEEAQRTLPFAVQRYFRGHD